MKNCVSRVVSQSITYTLLLSNLNEVNAQTYFEEYFTNNHALEDNYALDDYALGYNDYCYDFCSCSLFWLDAEYLYWQMKDSPRMPPLVFTGIFDAAVTPSINTAGTSIVLGNKSNFDHGRSGIKLSAGYCFSSLLMFAIEISYMGLEKNSTLKSVHSNDFHEGKVTSDSFPDNSYLAIPFFDVAKGMESSAYIAKPGEFAGKANLKTTNWMQGFEWNFIAPPNIFSFCSNFQVQPLAGFRYWNFKDKLTFTTTSPSTTTTDVFTTRDEFKTDNSFYGGQIGFNAIYERGPFALNAKAKIAFGAMDERLSIRGSLFTNNFTDSGTVLEIPGGYFALPSNIGHYDKTRFAYLPEINLNFSYEIGRNFRFNIGYTFLYVSRVFWAENQIDPNINPTQSSAITREAPQPLTGKPSPKALLKSKDFWVQGLNIGFDYRF